MSDDDCRETEGCALHGRCTMTRGGCFAAKDDCRETRACKQRGECTAVGEKCLATTNEDCAASEVCKRFGWCSARNVGSDREPRPGTWSPTGSHGDGRYRDAEPLRSLYMFSNTTLRAFVDDLVGFDLSKGTVRFQPQRPLPAALVKRLVAARLAECGLKKAQITLRKDSLHHISVLLGIFIGNLPRVG